MLIATTVLASLATVLFGVGPALRISRVDLVNDLKGTIATGGGPLGSRRWQARNVLVVGQIALSLALLCTGGLFARAALKAAAADPGFRYDQLLLAGIDPSLVGLRRGARPRRASVASSSACASIPGVSAAAFASTVPFGEFHEGMPVEAVGAEPNTGERRSPTYRIVSADYFRTLGLSMVRGREFTAAEEDSNDRGARGHRRRAAGAAAVPRSRSDRPDDPHRAARSRSGHGQRRRADGDRRHRAGPARHALRSRRRSRTSTCRRGATIARCSTCTSGPAAPARRPTCSAPCAASWRMVDARLPLLDLMPMRRFHDRSLELWAVRAGGNMVTALGLLALLLAVVGVYGVKSYVVSQPHERDRHPHGGRRAAARRPVDGRARGRDVDRTGTRDRPAAGRVCRAWASVACSTKSARSIRLSSSAPH